jgi:hypothetical protein
MTALRDAVGTPAAWPLTAIEELDHYLENPGEPSLVHLETHARGHLDPAALAAALAAVLAADPTAGRRLAPPSRWGRRLYWQAGPPQAGPALTGPVPADAAALLTTVSWASAAQLAALRERLSAWPMSLRDTAVRVILAAGPEHDVVIVQAHHAAFDGISHLALLTALAAAYRERAGDRPLPAAPPPPIRAVSAVPASAPPAPAPALASASWPPALAPTLTPAGTAGLGRGRTAGARRRRLSRLPRAVTRIAPRTAQPDRPGYGFVLVSIPVPRPARRGAAPHPTVNDLLVAGLILTIDRWNRVQGRHSGQIRITVPVNDRDPRRRWTGAGNQTRLIRVSAGPRQRADPAGLLAHVAARTRAGKQPGRGPGLDGMSRLLAAGWAPTAVKHRTARLVRRLAAPVGTDTSLVSNLGALPEPPCFSGGGPEPVWLSGPAPMPRGLAVGAITVAGQLHLCVHYRHALLDQAAAADFTAAYRRALAELASPVDPGPADPRPAGPGPAALLPANPGPVDLGRPR